MATTADDILMELVKEFTWQGVYKDCVGFEYNKLELQDGNNQLQIDISLEGEIKDIHICCSEPMEIERLYHHVLNVRQFEYLFDGTFYETDKYIVDGKDYTEELEGLEIGYLKCGKNVYKINLNLSDIEYAEMFNKWLAIEDEINLISQMVLYGKNAPNMPADLRLAMISQIYEPFAEYLESKNMISISAQSRTYVCENCGFQKTKILHSTFYDCLNAIITKYGSTIFSTELKGQGDFISRIVATRVKVFHANKNKRNAYGGFDSSIYSIKLELLYRYIILLIVGNEKDKLDKEIIRITKKLEYTYFN